MPYVGFGTGFETGSNILLWCQQEEISLHNHLPLFVQDKLQPRVGASWSLLASLRPVWLNPLQVVQPAANHRGLLLWCRPRTHHGHQVSFLLLNCKYFQEMRSLPSRPQEHCLYQTVIFVSIAGQLVVLASHLSQRWRVAWISDFLMWWDNVFKKVLFKNENFPNNQIVLFNLTNHAKCPKPCKAFQHLKQTSLPWKRHCVRPRASPCSGCRMLRIRLNALASCSLRLASRPQRTRLQKRSYLGEKERGEQKQQSTKTKNKLRAGTTSSWSTLWSCFHSDLNCKRFSWPSLPRNCSLQLLLQADALHSTAWIPTTSSIAGFFRLSFDLFGCFHFLPRFGSGSGAGSSEELLLKVVTGAICGSCSIHWKAASTTTNLWTAQLTAPQTFYSHPLLCISSCYLETEENANKQFSIVTDSRKRL